MPLHYAAGKPGVPAALIKLLKAKGQNLLSQEGVGTTSPQGKFVPPDPAQAAGDLRLARQQASDIQGTDPLAAKQPGQNISEDIINQERIRGLQDDGTNPFSKDLDTFPDDALSDPADVGAPTGPLPGQVRVREAPPLPKKGIGEQFQEDFNAMSRAEKDEVNQMHREVVNEASLDDAAHEESFGQATDSAKENMSIDFDETLRMEGIEGARRFHREVVGRPVQTPVSRYAESGKLESSSPPGEISYEAGLLMDQAADGIENVDPVRLARLRELDPGLADSVEKLARDAGRPPGVGRATLADDIDDIPF
jgi:hypothetical protein